MQYQLRITDPRSKGVSADVLVDATMDFLGFHLYLESLLSLEAGGVACFFVIDKEGERVVELTLFEDGDAGATQRLMEGIPLEEYVEAGGLCFDYAFGIFLDMTVHIVVTHRYENPLRSDVPACIARNGRFRFDTADPLLRNMDDIEELLQECYDKEGFGDEE